MAHDPSKIIPACPCTNRLSAAGSSSARMPLARIPDCLSWLNSDRNLTHAGLVYGVLPLNVDSSSSCPIVFHI